MGAAQASTARPEMNDTVGQSYDNHQANLVEVADGQKIGKMRSIRYYVERIRCR
jgi:hypothetical protein